MEKTLLTLITAVIYLVLYIPVCFALETGTSSQGTETKMLHAEHVFNANATIGGLLDFGKSKYGERRIIPITGGT